MGTVGYMWQCLKCGFLNGSMRLQCRNVSCRADRPGHAPRA
jgi:hypothetical protein